MTGMYPGADKTAPGGMPLPALKIELVEEHGYKMADLRDIKWGRIIEMVAAERLAREAEQPDLSDYAEDFIAQDHEPETLVDSIAPITSAIYSDEDWPDSTDDLDDDDAEYMVTEMKPLVEDIAAGATPSTRMTEQAVEVINRDTEPGLDPEQFMAEVEAAHAEYEASALFIGMPNTRDFIFDGHAGAGPSGAERWMNCTASLGAAREFLETLTPNQQHAFASGSGAARQGTTAHAVGEVRVREALGEVDSTEVEHTLMELALAPDDVTEAYSEEMNEYVNEYVDLAQTYIDAGHEVKVEQRVMAAIPLTATGLVEDDVYVIAGSADLVVLPTTSEPVLTVGDLKYGNGIDVDPDSNPQIRIYALGVLGDLVDEDGDLPEGLDRIEYVICQPRLGGIKVWTESVDDLLTWRDDVLSPALTAALGGPDYGATFTPSDLSCQWCPARGTCAALTEQRIAEAGGLFDAINEGEFDGTGAAQPSALSDTRLGEILTQVNALVGLRDSLKEEAQRRLHRGGEVPGFKMVSYTPPRKWIEGAADKIAQGQVKGLPKKEREALFKEPVLRTPTQAVALLGDGASVLADLIDVPAKRPVIAPENDRRHTWTGLAPEAMFQIEEEK